MCKTHLHNMWALSVGLAWATSASADRIYVDASADYNRDGIVDGDDLAKFIDVLSRVVDVESE